MKVHKPKTIKEAVDNLQEFLECDLYTRFRPAQTIPIGKDGKLFCKGNYQDVLVETANEVINRSKVKLDLLQVAIEKEFID